MNKVEAFIRPEKLDNVKDALANEGILGLSVIQVTGRGVQRGVRTGGRGTQSYMASMLHQSKIEIVVSENVTQTGRSVGAVNWSECGGVYASAGSLAARTASACRLCLRR